MDLLRYAKKKRSYLNLISNGDNILSVSALPSCTVKKTVLRKKAYILHIPAKEGDSVGHWSIALLELKTRSLLFIDPLNTISKTRPEVTTMITEFCKRNALAWSNWNVTTQTTSSKCCGLIILYFLHFFSNHSLNGFEQLRNMLKNYSVTIREAIILKKFYRIFNT